MVWKNDWTKVYIGMNFLVKVFLFFLEEDSFSSRLEKGEEIMEIEVGSSDSSFLNEARGSMERCKLFLSSFEFLQLVACSRIFHAWETKDREREGKMVCVRDSVGDDDLRSTPFDLISIEWRVVIPALIDMGAIRPVLFPVYFELMNPIDGPRHLITGNC